MVNFNITETRQDDRPSQTEEQSSSGTKTQKVVPSLGHYKKEKN